MHLKFRSLSLCLFLLVVPFQLAYSQPLVQYDIPYVDIPPGIDSTLLSLDVYTPANASHLPVIVWVHGGAWTVGDKASVFYKSEWLNSNEFVFVSVNYRLSPFLPALGNPDRIKHPTHVQDVAAAVGFVRQEAASWGGDPDRMILMGHSAGGHLVSLVATDTRYLEAHGMTPTDVLAVVSLDTGAYNVADIMNDGLLMNQYLNAFTEDSTVWADASPIHYVTPDVPLPPFMLVHQTTPRQTTSADAFASVLEEAGHTVTTYPAPGMSHEDINRWLGGPENPVYTDDVLSFLSETVSTSTDIDRPAEDELDNRPAIIGPNPTYGQLALSLPGDAEVYVVDILGRVRSRLNGTSGILQLNLDAFPPGVYMIIVVQNGQKHIYRAVRI